MNSKRKTAMMGQQNLDRAQEKLTAAIKIAIPPEKVADDVLSDAGMRLTDLLRHSHIAGFADTLSNESKESVKWFKQQLIDRPEIIYVIAAATYCGILQATLVLPQYGDVQETFLKENSDG